MQTTRPLAGTSAAPGPQELSLCVLLTQLLLSSPSWGHARSTSPGLRFLRPATPCTVVFRATGGGEDFASILEPTILVKQDHQEKSLSRIVYWGDHMSGRKASPVHAVPLVFWLLTRWVQGFYVIANLSPRVRGVTHPTGHERKTCVGGWLPLAQSAGMSHKAGGQGTRATHAVK